MQNTKRKISCRHVEPNSRVTISLEATGTVQSNSEADGEQRELRLSSVRVRNHYTTLVDGKPVEKVGEVLFETSEDVVLVVFGGASQRVSCTGLSRNERDSIAAAPTEQLADTLAGKSAAEKAALARSLLSSLTEEERANFLTTKKTHL